MTLSWVKSDDVEVADAGAQVAILGLLAVELDLQAQVVERIGIAQGIFVADLAGLVEIKQGLVEGLHAEFARLLHDFLDLMDIALEDQGGNQRRIEHDLDGCYAALAILLGKQ